MSDLPGETDIRSDDAGYLVITAAGQTYALPSNNVVMAVDMPRCTAMPGMPAAVRGVIRFMEEAVPLYDLRRMLGLPSFPEEIDGIVNTLRERKQDHLRWLDNLKDAVYHDKEITVQTDPHKCRFGLWYDRFTTDSVTLSHYMARFDKPHKEIHGLAIRAQELITRGLRDAAKEIIHEAENSTLVKLVALFDDADRQVRRFSYEYAVVVELTGRKIAVAVDSLRHFGTFDEVVHDLPLSAFGPEKFVEAVGRMRTGSVQEDVLILNIGQFVREADAGSSPA